MAIPRVKSDAGSFKPCSSKSSKEVLTSFFLRGPKTYRPSFHCDKREHCRTTQGKRDPATSEGTLPTEQGSNFWQHLDRSFQSFDRKTLRKHSRVKSHGQTKDVAPCRENVSPHAFR